MSLLQDPDYLITHLRAKYVDSIHDSVAPALVKPVPGYLRHDHSKDWQNESLTILLKAESPPVASSSLNEKALAYRRQKLRLEDMSDEDEDEMADDENHTNGGVVRLKRRNTQKRVSGVPLAQSYMDSSDTYKQQDIMASGGFSGQYDDSNSSGDDDDFDEEESEDEIGGSGGVLDVHQLTPRIDDHHSSDSSIMSSSEDDEEIIVVPSMTFDEGTSLSGDAYAAISSANVDSELDPQSSYIYPTDEQGLVVDSDDSDEHLEMPISKNNTKSSMPRATSTASVTTAGSSLSKTANSNTSWLSQRREPQRQTSVDVIPEPQSLKNRRRMSGVVPPRPRSNTTASLPAESTQKVDTKLFEKDFSRLQLITERKHTSLLSSQIQDKSSTLDNPLDEYMSASGKATKKPLNIYMYMPSSSCPDTPWEVSLLPDVTVSRAIGFALYTYSLNRLEPALTTAQCDANLWNCYMVEDGEVDEDIVLDRTTELSRYGEEFALVEASPSEYSENKKRTPNKFGVEAKTNAASPGAAGVVPVSVPPTMIIDDDSTTALPTTIERETVRLRIHLESTNTVTLNVDRGSYLAEVLETICKRRTCDTSLYTLALFGTKIIAPGDRTVEALQGHHELELLQKKYVSQSVGYIYPPKSQNPAAPIIPRGSAALFTHTGSVAGGALGKLSGKSLKHAPQNFLLGPSSPSDDLGSDAYQKYQVWRRQPMSFISKHEKVLAFDGEYIHIMPSDDKTKFETSKTSSFHVGRIIKCKQSRKVPSNFKIVVNKPSGPKRYDLEAVSVSQCVEIVTKIRHRCSAYVKSRNG